MTEAAPLWKKPAGLARGTKAAAAPRAESPEYLGFLLGSTQYGLPLVAVREILKPPPITTVPRTASDILGVCSLRGRVITVFDVRVRLRAEPSTTSRQSRIIVIDDGDETKGLWVDRVLQVYRMKPEEIEPGSAAGSHVAPHVVGIARPHEGGLLLLLDPRATFRRSR